MPHWGTRRGYLVESLTEVILQREEGAGTTRSARALHVRAIGAHLLLLLLLLGASGREKCLSPPHMELSE